MTPPVCTYRLQFSPDFDFRQCLDVLPYLGALGVSHIYASPIFTARPGSSHGYDVCDPTALNPELGGEEAFLSLTARVKELGLHWLQDIVPNHMAVTGRNPFLVDVLENGEASRFFHFFDIDWQHPLESIHGRMLAPFLGSFYGDTLEQGEITLGFDAEGFHINYHDLRFPVRIDSYARILNHGLKELRKRLGREHTDYIKILGILYSIKGLPAEDATGERYQQIHFIKRMLHELDTQSEDIRGYVRQTLDVFNGAASREDNRFDLLNDLLAEQHFRLSYWKVAGEEINYRRFFSINDLICLRVEDESVFEQTHSLILDYIRKSIFAGVRVDHIDGLYDPSAYLKRLREHAPKAWILVEKILMDQEPLPSFWPVQGTTGYEFMDAACGLFVPPENEAAFDALYKAFIGKKRTMQTLVAKNKRKIIERHMAGDVENLARLVNRVSSRDRHGFDITLLSLKRAIAELLINFPVYRTYISHDAFRPADLGYIRSAIRQTKRKNPELRLELDFMERFLLLEFEESLREEDRRLWIQFVMRFQQFTGPLMAKGVEDTTFYVMNRLLCRNEVGSEPHIFGRAPQEVHGFLKERGKNWSQGMNATATHDTKRGEDARMRLAALAGMPEEFRRALKRFGQLNSRKRRNLGDRHAPERNDEYLLYQTLLATWPWEQGEMQEYPRRIRDYLIKAVREGKENSDWIEPNLEYEQALTEFADSLLKPGRNAFLSEFAPLREKAAHQGMLHSLGQTLLKLTAPGVPDIYQGAELWDLSLVDPDNRRPVDFKARAAMLHELQRAHAEDPESLLQELLDSPHDGRIKLFTLWRGLAARRALPLLFRYGEYHPLEFEGPRAPGLFGFLRAHEEDLALVLLPRDPSRIHPEAFASAAAWREPLARYLKDTYVLLPPREDMELRNVFSGASLKLPPTTEGGVRLEAGHLLADFPVGLWCTCGVERPANGLSGEEPTTK